MIMITPVEKAMSLLDEYRQTQNRETICEVLHMLEKFIDIRPATTVGYRNAELDMTCQRCGVAIIGKNGKKKYCGDCRREVRSELQKRARERRK